MNKIFAEDFYDWHPTTLMASKSFYDGTVVRLYSEDNFKTSELSYLVSVSNNGDIDQSRFECLIDAINFYNERMVQYATARYC